MYATETPSAGPQYHEKLTTHGEVSDAGRARVKSRRKP
jgi:hypothetical protein